MAAVLLLAWGVSLGVARLAGRLDRRSGRAGWHGPAPRVGLALAFAALAGGTVVVVVLARGWRAAPLAIDIVAAESARLAWSPMASLAMRSVTLLGDPPLLAVVGLAVGAALVRMRQWLLLAGWAMALLGNAWLNPALKGLYARIRPVADLELTTFGGYSFPSGHTSGAVVCFGMLVYLCWRLAPRHWLMPALCAAATVVVLVGASRILLQAHYLSDVIGGAASGAAWLALTIASCAALSRACHN